MAEAAGEFFRRVLALEPERLEALVNLANLLRETGQAEAADALLEPALARSPEAPELWLALGSAHRALGDAPRPNAISARRWPAIPIIRRRSAISPMCWPIAARWTRRSRSMTAPSSATARMRRPASTAPCCISSRAI